MAGKNITRADLAEAVQQKVGLSRAESAGLVAHVIEEICFTLATGENVKLSSFGVFTVRRKGKRLGRNPKTKEAVPIEPRQSITFHASPILQSLVNGGKKKPARRRAKRVSLLEA